MPLPGSIDRLRWGSGWNHPLPRPPAGLFSSSPKRESTACRVRCSMLLLRCEGQQRLDRVALVFTDYRPKPSPAPSTPQAAPPAPAAAAFNQPRLKASTTMSSSSSSSSTAAAAVPGLEEVRAALKEAGQEHVLQVFNALWMLGCA